MYSLIDGNNKKVLPKNIFELTRQGKINFSVDISLFEKGVKFLLYPFKDTQDGSRYNIGIVYSIFEMKVEKVLL